MISASVVKGLRGWWVKSKIIADETVVKALEEQDYSIVT